MTPEQVARLAELRTAYDTAAKQDRQAAWAALDAYAAQVCPPKKAGRSRENTASARSGRRQAAEREAQRIDALRRQYRR